MEELFSLLNAIHPVSGELTAYLHSRLIVKTLSKRDYLLKAGQICRHICFIRQGLLRCFYIKDEREVCSWYLGVQINEKAGGRHLTMRIQNKHLMQAIILPDVR